VAANLPMSAEHLAAFDDSFGKTQELQAVDWFLYRCAVKCLFHDYFITMITSSSASFQIRSICLYSLDRRHMAL
jgi:hypothetical protein